MSEEYNESRQASFSESVHSRASSSSSSSSRASIQEEQGPQETCSIPAAGIKAIDGVVEGWRIWRVEDGVLRSLWKTDIWDPEQAQVSHHPKALRLPSAGLFIAAILLLTMGIINASDMSGWAAFDFTVFAFIAWFLWHVRQDWNLKRCQGPCVQTLRFLPIFGCGLYAWDSRERAEALGKATCGTRYRDFKLVLGRVALWGEVVEYQRGYAAQYAYPVSFDAVFDRLAGDWVGIDKATLDVKWVLSKFQ